MGARVSTNRKQVNIDTSLTIKKSTDIMINNRTDTYSATTSTNQFTLTNKGEIIGDIDISQKIDINKTITAKVDANITSKMKDEILNNLNAEVDQTTKTGMGAFFAGVGVVTSEDKQNIKKAFEYAVNKKVTQENIQAVIDKTTSVNDGKITNEGKITGNIKVDQSIAVNITITNIIQQIFDEANDFLVDNNSDLTLKQASDTKFAGLETYALGASGCLSCLLCCVCLAILIFMLSSGGQESSVILANAAGRRIAA